MKGERLKVRDHYVVDRTSGPVDPVIHRLSTAYPPDRTGIKVRSFWQGERRQWSP